VLVDFHRLTSRSTNIWLSLEHSRYIWFNNETNYFVQKPDLLLFYSKQCHGFAIVLIPHMCCQRGPRHKWHSEGTKSCMYNGDVVGQIIWILVWEKDCSFSLNCLKSEDVFYPERRDRVISVIFELKGVSSVVFSSWILLRNINGLHRDLINAVNLPKLKDGND